jgi:hypothetical protein
MMGERVAEPGAGTLVASTLPAVRRAHVVEGGCAAERSGHDVSHLPGVLELDGSTTVHAREREL